MSRFGPLMSAFVDHRMNNLAKYGFMPRVRQPELTVAEVQLLDDALELKTMIDEDLGFWNSTNARKTIDNLGTARAAMSGIIQGMTADSNKFQRCAFALQGKTLKNFVKAIRCPRTRDETKKENTVARRHVFKNKLKTFVRELYELVRPLPDDQQFAEFLETQEHDLADDAVVVQDVESDEVEMNDAAAPEHMYA